MGLESTLIRSNDPVTHPELLRCPWRFRNAFAQYVLENVVRRRVEILWWARKECSRLAFPSQLERYELYPNLCALLLPPFHALLLRQ